MSEQEQSGMVPYERKRATGNPDRERPQLKEQDVNTKERHAKVINLRQGGLSYDKIGELVGLHWTSVKRIIDKHLSKVARRMHEDTENVRLLELTRLDTMFNKAWTALLKAPAADIDTIAKANKSLLEIQARRARYQGLDKEVPYVNVNIHNNAPETVMIPLIHGATDEELRAFLEQWGSIKTRNDGIIIDAAARLTNESAESTESATVQEREQNGD